MRSLDLDYLRTMRPKHWPGLLLLALGALSVIAVNREGARIEHRIEVYQGQLSTGRQAALPVSERDAAAFGAQIRAAHATYTRLATPWSAFFDAIEAAQIPGVRLDAVEPDASQRTAVFSGQARNYVAVLNYVNALEAKGGLTRVHLTRHERRAQDPAYPIAFTIQVSWSGIDPGAPTQNKVRLQGPQS